MCRVFNVMGVFDRGPPGGDNQFMSLGQIKLAGAPSAEQDAVDMLLACHQRIRSLTTIALRLADAEEATPAEVINAAESVHRYYTVALPLHEADENDSLYPRLRRALAGEDFRAAELMVEQHGPIDATVAALVPLWAELRSCPERLPVLRPELRRNASRLQELWNEHLALEEEIVFPLIRSKLGADDLQAMHREMKQRRGIERQ